MLRTRSPLYSPPEGGFLARLACIKHAASVRSEPGSNSPSIIINSSLTNNDLVYYLLKSWISKILLLEHENPRPE